MSEYAHRLSAISDKKNQLLDEEKRLVSKRKSEISTLAEKYGLLTASDALMTGMFKYAQKALHDNAGIIGEWEALGLLSQKSRTAQNKNRHIKKNLTKKNDPAKETAFNKQDSHAFQNSSAAEKSQSVSVKT